ncbi:sulfatase-like hydrolase/transferase [Puniceicoccus vermicola]|uniref:Sulfatase-like hydrolase/transferase n=1 Tax=Puniceicoccus vermicola TaxID=388746 RepID=A0A7X1E522_9BACT|nr:sulfatase-like hydrolase/transferase [Puniceicoccus vermicola]MBC2602674.1 sulfatase-like hydrolase/transferase [Puniceicoccus vermicola]
MQPNIIVFFTDQQRWDTLGLNGNKSGLTPNFDRLARQGTFFKQAVTPQPVCGPARSCIQTGQYATTSGVWRNGLGLKEESPKLAELLADGGYRTGYIGKWHLSPSKDEGPVPLESRAGYQDWLAANATEIISGPYSARLWDVNDQEVQLPGYRVDAQTDAMIRYLYDRASEPKESRKPFLLFNSYIEPHHQNTNDSYPAPRGYEEQYRDAPLPPDLRSLGGTGAQHWPGYCGMIKRLDEALGRTMDALISEGLDKNTIVVFISDHGNHFKTRNNEYKRTAHESSVRVPFAIWGPGWDGGGERNEAVSLVDLMPTLLDSAGVQIPGDVQGRSLLPLSRNATKGWPEESFIQFGDNSLPPGRAIRTNRWKYVVTSALEFKSKGAAPVYTESHLFDLECDPYELDNLVHLESHSAIREDLRRRLITRMTEIGEPSAEIKFAPSSNSGQRTASYPNTDTQ